MTLVEKYAFVINYFVTHNTPTSTELNYDNDFQLLIAVILSAQCTDKRVNSVTKHLFKAFPSIESLAKSQFKSVYPYIKSISYPNNKTKYLIASACMLQEEYESKVPHNIQSLQKLPGVGRKTAHVILSTLYQEAVIAVDTHVFRVSKRLGLVYDYAKTPLAVEKILVKHTPKLYLSKMHHWLIHHGRYTCKARRPLCIQCPFTLNCNYYNLGLS